ncbi:hypothetical protein U1Q18_043371 [Sarracenia purpurea var. burkii]
MHYDFNSHMIPDTDLITNMKCIGVAGWGTGLKLGSESKGIQYTGHRNIGIALFSLATVQVFEFLLRPKNDHKLRFYWNIYHHGIGYAIHYWCLKRSGNLHTLL